MVKFSQISICLSLFGLAFSSLSTPRSTVNGACTGSGGAPGVCISTSSCSSGGGTYISNACPGTPEDIKCCTKPKCGSGGNCRWTSQCSGTTVSNLCPGPASFKCCEGGSGGGSEPSTPGGPIKRSEIIQRGEYWISRHVPYSMSKTYPDPQGVKYRTDCSGFVSMALHSSAPGRNTDSLLQIATKLNSWNDLKPGDFVGTLGAGTGGSGGHVTLFKSWVDSAKTKYNSLECRGTAYGCIAYVRKVGWTNENGVAAKPYRYIHVI